MEATLVSALSPLLPLSLGREATQLPNDKGSKGKKKSKTDVELADFEVGDGNENRKSPAWIR